MSVEVQVLAGAAEVGITATLFDSLFTTNSQAPVGSTTAATGPWRGVRGVRAGDGAGRDSPCRLRRRRTRPLRSSTTGVARVRVEGDDARRGDGARAARAAAAIAGRRRRRASDRRRRASDPGPPTARIYSRDHRVGREGATRRPAVTTGPHAARVEGDRARAPPGSRRLASPCGAARRWPSRSMSVPPCTILGSSRLDRSTFTTSPLRAGTSRLVVLQQREAARLVAHAAAPSARERAGVEGHQAARLGGLPHGGVHHVERACHPRTGPGPWAPRPRPRAPPPSTRPGG